MKVHNSANGTIRIAGYAAIFNRLDKGGDIIRPRAFDALHNDLPDDLPLLWQHDPAQEIGHVDYAKVDKRGLRVIASLHDNERAIEAITLLKQRAIEGLSFGYRVHRSHGRNPRELLALDVAEISLVTFPMQPLAKVHLVQ